MVKIYICEDNLQHLKEIERHINYYASFSDWHMQLALATAYPEKILEEVVIDEEPNIYLFDIELTETSTMNGFQLAKKIRERDPHGYLVFLTGHIELTYLTFKFHVSAIDFIEKEGPEDWQRRLTDCLKSIEKQLAVISEKKEKEVLKVETLYGISYYFLEEIVAFESMPDHKIILYTDNEKVTILRTTLNGLETKFKTLFFRCHRSFLVNCRKVKKVEPAYSCLTMENHLEVPVSYRNRGKLRKLLEQIFN